MKKILIIEDNFEVRDNLAEILELDGYDVTQAENGKIGVSRALEGNFDLIICDVMMPELDGYGVLKILNKNPKTYHIPFIFLTAKADKSDLRKGMGLGADDYITKPFDDMEILEAIEIRIAKKEKLSIDFQKPNQSLQSMFSSVNAQKGIDELNKDRELRHYGDKTLIYEEDQIPRFVYYVVSGQVKVFQSNDFGKALITNLYNEGEYFGFLPLMSQLKYKDNAMTVGESTLRLIPKEDFTNLLFNNRDFSAQFIQMMANKAQNVESQLISYAYSSVRKRVSNALLLFEKDGIVSASRENLAASAGTAKETLIRTLSDLKEEGILKMEGRQIIIQDSSSLINMPE